MITAHHLSKTYLIKPILDNVSLHIGPGDRVGLIGANGSGKSTLMRILAGKEAPDEGVVTLNPADLRIGFLDQGLDIPDEETVKHLFLPDKKDSGDPESELINLAKLLGSNPEREDLQSAYDETLLRLNNGIKQSTRVKEVLEKFGLGEITEDQRVGTLSGGQKTRLALARIILEKPELLLLDEPTNHLDIKMLEWLEDWLRNFSGGALIVSHDRTFLDNTVNQILDLDPETHTLKMYSGNYSAYLEQYLSARERQETLYRNQEAEMQRLRQDINRTKQQALRVELTTTSRQPGVRRYAKKVARKAKSREKKLDRYLESDERIEKPGQTWQMKLQFSEPNHRSQDVLHCADLSIGYPGFFPLVENINLQVRAGERIAVTGPNGGGKTTLLRTIAGELQPVEGRLHIGPNIRRGYMSQEQEGLDQGKSAFEMIQAYAPFNETEARSFLHFYLFTGDDSLRPTQDLSYGERARLSLALLVAAGNNLLLLDEPINHLDIPSRARFEQALKQFSGTILAVVHDRYFIQRFATSVWTITHGMLFQERLYSPS